MSIEIPDKWLGKPVEGALERALQSGKTKKVPATPATPSKVIQPTTVITDPQNWMVLEGRTHGTDNYPDLMVSMHRLGMSPRVEQLAKTLRYNVANTAEEKDGTPYIGNIDWTEALTLNVSLGNRTLTPRQGIDLLLDLRESISGKSKKNRKVIYDGNAQPIDPDRIKGLYEEIIKVREPWRGEWLDARFRKVGTGMFIDYDHKLSFPNKGLHNLKSVLLGSYMGDADYMDLESASLEGLGTKKSRAQTLYFWPPSGGTVAGFGADSGGAGLVCDEDPANRDSGLGVRPAREKN